MPTTAEATDAKPADGKAGRGQARQGMPTPRPTRLKPGESRAGDQRGRRRRHRLPVRRSSSICGPAAKTRTTKFDFHFDNVPFVLNVLDTLAGDDRFVEIRTRRPAHRTLTRVNEATEKSRDEADQGAREVQQEVRAGQWPRPARSSSRQLDEARKARPAATSSSSRSRCCMARENGQRQLDTKLERSSTSATSRSRRPKRDLASEVHNVQDKLQAVGGAAAADSAVDRGLHRVFQSPGQRARGRVEGPAALSGVTSDTFRPRSRRGSRALRLQPRQN